MDDFRERAQPEVGKVHDPIQDTMYARISPDHTYGVLIEPDEYGAGDLIHGRAPGSYLGGKDRERGILAAIRQNLKKSNYHNFHDLNAAFRFYDKVCTLFSFILISFCYVAQRRFKEMIILLVHFHLFL